MHPGSQFESVHSSISVVSKLARAFAPASRWCIDWPARVVPRSSTNQGVTPVCKSTVEAGTEWYKVSGRGVRDDIRRLMP